MRWSPGLTTSAFQNAEHAEGVLAAGAVNDIRRAWRDRPDAKLYLFVDPILRDPFADDDISVERDVVPVQYRDLQKNTRPYLLRLPESDRMDQLLTRTLEIAREEWRRTRRPVARSISGWFFETRSVQFLTRQLAAAAVVRDHAGEQHLFRYWDPRVLPELARGQACRALLPDIEGPWMSLAPDGMVRASSWSAGAKVPAQKRLSSMDVAAERELDELSRYNDIRSRIVEISGDCSLWPARSALSSHVRISEQLGLARWSDRREFAARRHLADAPIERSAAMQRVITACRDQDASYERLVAMWAENEWSAVAAEVSEPKATAGTIKVREMNR